MADDRYGSVCFGAVGVEVRPIRRGDQRQFERRQTSVGPRVPWRHIYKHPTNATSRFDLIYYRYSSATFCGEWWPRSSYRPSVLSPAVYSDQLKLLRRQDLHRARTQPRNNCTQQCKQPRALCPAHAPAKMFRWQNFTRQMHRDRMTCGGYISYAVYTIVAKSLLAGLDVFYDMWEIFCDKNTE